MRVYPKGYKDSKNDFAETGQMQQDVQAKENNAFAKEFDTAFGIASEQIASEVDSFTNEQKANMIRLFYSLVKHKGTIFPNDGRQPYTLDSIKAMMKRKHKVNQADKGTETNHLNFDYFYLDDALKNHVTGGSNLGIFFKQEKCSVIAFDFDSEKGFCDETAIADAQVSAHSMVIVAYKLGLTAFMYYSGGKGYHVEIFFDEDISINKLNALNNIMLHLHRERGGKHIDGVYPSLKAYRVFGCKHYKTGKFTHAYRVEIIDKELIILALSPADSWELFSHMPLNDSALVDKIIADYLGLGKFTKDKKGKKVFDSTYAPSLHYWDVGILKQIHESGLFAPYTRYNTAFQLGRYFKHKLKIRENEARTEIITWLKRHFKEQCNAQNGLKPFDGAYNNAVKSPYATCELETLNNCLKGYRNGKPFNKERVKINFDAAAEYIRRLGYSHKKEQALLKLLNNAQQYNSLDRGYSYDELLSLFRVGSRSTVRSWLEKFQDDFIFICISKGSYKSRKTSQYRLVLPKNCYTVIDSKNANPKKCLIGDGGDMMQNHGGSNAQAALADAFSALDDYESRNNTNKPVDMWDD